MSTQDQLAKCQKRDHVTDMANMYADPVIDQVLADIGVKGSPFNIHGYFPKLAMARTRPRKHARLCVAETVGSEALRRTYPNMTRKNDKGVVEVVHVGGDDPWMRQEIIHKAVYVRLLNGRASDWEKPIPSDCRHQYGRPEQAKPELADTHYAFSKRAWMDRGRTVAG